MSIDHNAVKFFRSQGFNPGRSVQLARAEAHAAELGWVAEWSPDEEGELGDHGEWCDEAARGDDHSHEILSCVLRDSAGSVLASLGGIIDPERSYGRVVEAELAEEAMAHAAEEAKRAARPYCRPSCAGLASEPQAVARRLSRLMNALDFEITGYVVDGESRILDGITALKRETLLALRAEGWRVDYLETPGKWRVLAGKRARS